MPKAFLSLVIGIIAILLPLTSLKVHAQADFANKVDTTFTYNAELSGTQVNQIFSITNLTAETFISEYAIEIGSASLQQLTVTIPDQPPVDFTQTQTDNSTVINLKIPNPIVGKDKVLTIELSYITNDIALVKGNVVEISIPDIVKQDEDFVYNTKIRVPTQLGNPSVISPQPDSINQQPEFTEFQFNDPKGSSAISAIFGDYQGVSFILTYHLVNVTPNDGLVQIALPPDTPYQKLHYEVIEPPPSSLHADADGNWLGTYHLKPNQQIDVIAKGEAVMYLHPVVQVPQQEPSPEMLKSIEPYWPVNNQRIKEIVKENSTPRQIYDYVVSTLSYNYNRVGVTNERLGALAALEQPENALCQEFTDLFITLARSAGIPAREVNGYAFTQNNTLRPLSLVPETLHAWPEYYDYESKQWVPVDPTWGHTTGGSDYFTLWDYNHFTFVVHGLDAVKPYPAGYYQTDGTIDKDVLITYTDNQTTITPEVSFVIKQNPLSTIGIPLSSTIEATNNTGAALYNIEVKTESNTFTSNHPTLVFEQLLPFSSQSKKIRLLPSNIIDFSPSSITLHAYGRQQEYQLNKAKDYSLYFASILLAVGGISAAGAFITRRLLVSLKRK